VAQPQDLVEATRKGTAFSHIRRHSREENSAFANKLKIYQQIMFEEFETTVGHR
jgi:hypothetical protein